MAAEYNWITVKGKHIPVQKGQSKKEAISKAVGGDGKKYGLSKRDKLQNSKGPKK